MDTSVASAVSVAGDTFDNISLAAVVSRGLSGMELGMAVGTAIEVEGTWDSGVVFGNTAERVVCTFL